MTNFVVEVRFVIVTPLHPHFFEERYALVIFYIIWDAGLKPVQQNWITFAFD